MKVILFMIVITLYMTMINELPFSIMMVAFVWEKHNIALLKSQGFVYVKRVEVVWKEEELPWKPRTLMQCDASLKGEIHKMARIFGNERRGKSKSSIIRKRRKGAQHPTKSPVSYTHEG